MAGKARVKRKLSPEEIAYNKAKEVYKAAKDKAKKAHTADNVAHAEAAQKAMKEAHEPVKITSFKRIAESRTGKAIIGIRTIGNLFAPRSYTYTEEQGTKLIAALTSEITALEAKFKASLSTAPVTPEAKQKAFSFD